MILQRFSHSSSDGNLASSAVKRSICFTISFHKDVKLGHQHNYHKGRMAIRYYAYQPARPL